MSRGRSPRVRAFCLDKPRSIHGITIVYPKSSSHFISLIKFLKKMVTIVVNIVTKYTYWCYNVVMPRTPYTTLVATDRGERLGFSGECKWSGVVATSL